MSKEKEAVSPWAVGEKVVAQFRGMSNDYRVIGLVKSIGKISITCEFPTRGAPIRFSLDGRETGNSYHAARLYKASPELIEEVRMENRNAKIRRALENTSWHKITDEKAEACYAILYPSVIVSALRSQDGK